MRIPVIGRVPKPSAERILRSRKGPRNPFSAQGHIGQVVPLEDAEEILRHCAAEPIIEKNSVRMRPRLRSPE
jgi:hypothetical protein